MSLPRGAKLPQVNGARAWQWLEQLAAITEPERPWTRCAFTPCHAAGRAWLRERFVEAGLAVRVDAAGNLIGRREGRVPGAPVLMVGSHSDTVPGGGRFDGMAGVVTGLELATALHEAGHELDHAFEVVDFLAEEPNPYGLSCIGSRGMAGALTAAMLERCDGNGVPLHQRLLEAGAGGVPVASAVRSDVRAFLELHIEQGPVLEERGLDVGIVTTIVGIRRLALRFVGQAAHAGTTPYVLRRDALVAASAFIAGLPAFIQAGAQPDAYLVATVGEMKVLPNAANVVPAVVELTVDLRSDHTAVLEAWSERVKAFAREAAERHEVELADCVQLSASEPAPCAPAVQNALRNAAMGLGFRQQDMVSGAGHDAAFLARVAPTGMVFVPSHHGMSHTADEWTDAQQLAKGMATLLGALLELDGAAA